MALVTVQRSPTPSTSSSPCVSESGSGEEDRRSQPRSISESFLTVKGAALFLPRGNGSSLSSASRFAQLRSKHAGDLQQHLQTMFTLLRPEDNIKLAVRLESSSYQGTRYMVVVSTNGRQDTEESLVLGVDFSPTDSSCSVGLVLPLWSDTLIHLDGDGGFSVSTDNRIHVFKPVSVQAMWSALQSLHKACEVARCHNYFPGSLFLTWVSYYQSRVSSDQSRINEWNAMKDVQSYRTDSPVLFSDVPTERERTERLIKTRLREIMMQKDLENVTCKEIRTELEEHMVCNLREFKEYIDNEMIVILGQMDSPTEIFDHVYLGSEWNASNLEELQNSGVQYILNVTREIDNFFPGLFEYHNIRVYDEEATDLLAYWNDTYKFISRAKKAGAKCLVHCKMGVSRSASTVIAYAMKEYGWDLERAFDYVKDRRAVTKPNPSFMRQLEEYQGILLASKQRHNKLWRSHSDSDLSEHHEPLCKPAHHTLGRCDPRNQGYSPNAPSLQDLLQPLGSPSNSGQMVRSVSESGTPSSAGKVVRSNSQPPFSAAKVVRSNSQPPSNAGKVVRSSLHQDTLTVDPSSSTPAEESSNPADSTCPSSGPQGERTDPQDSAPLAGSTFPQSAPISNGQWNLEDALTPLLPQPHVATAVPVFSTMTVIETVPVKRANFNASLPHLPSCPTPPPVADQAYKAQDPSSSLPALKSRLPHVPELQSSTPDVTSQTTGPQDLATPVPVRNQDCDQRLSGAEDIFGPPQPSGGELIIQPSPQDPTSLSTDHINFFSAREKFQGLAQDGRQPMPQPTPRAPGPDVQDEELPIEATGEGGEEVQGEEKKRESIISVHLIVTELESLAHSVSPPPGQPEPMASRELEVGQSNQEAEEKVAESQQEVRAIEEEVKDIAQETEAATHSAPAPVSDWAMGSVRRVTQQLEQRMRQEHDAPSPPPPSLPLNTNHAHRRSLVLPHTREHLPTSSHSLLEANSNPQNAPLYLEGLGVRNVQEEDDGACSPMEENGAHDVDEECLTEASGQMHKHPLSDVSPVPTLHLTSISHQPLALDTLCSGDVMYLEGVTELESSTDGGTPLPGQGPPENVIMRETLETLQELGAFLCQVSQGGDELHRCVGQVWGGVVVAVRPDRRRARDVEVRIRRAGLTPPSLLKRSASLAKLDCLDLSAKDLSDWELSPTPPATPSIESLPLATADEVSNKLRLRSHNATRLTVLTHSTHGTGGEGPVEGDHVDLGHSRSPPSSQGWLRGKLPDSSHNVSLIPNLSPVATRQLYGRTHPIRRLKKQTFNALYHTM
ncbi:hypothetical protein UPYG_G00127500 [Umbra pygmaea]|uniref:protein-serine/threonine phosphatase n=1 Tax=Umbra pygmaea TaxID=75934 RepID=A0ABD0X761_UMBPY